MARGVIGEIALRGLLDDPADVHHGELMRIGTRALTGVRDADRCQKFHGAVPGGLPADILVLADLLLDMPADLVTGFSQVIGSWKIMPMPADRPDLVLGHAHQIGATDHYILVAVG
jgi:hypothetical protein